MKNRITDFRRLRYAWDIASGLYKVYCIAFNRDCPEEHVCRTTALSAAEDYLRLRYADSAEHQEEFSSRLQMLRAVLDTDNSVILQFKQPDGECLASYDCQSEEDFQELRNQEFK